MTTLRQAAQAVLDRWDDPLQPTAEGLAALRKALEAPEQEPIGYVWKRDFIGSVIAIKGAWAPHEIPIYADPVEAPDIKALQAEGKGPAPCARFCESRAFETEIRNLEQLCISESTLRDNIIRGLLEQVDALTKERDALTLANKDLIDWFDALKADHDKLMAAGKLANAYVEWTAYGNCRADAGPIPTAAEVSAALKAAGVS